MARQLIEVALAAGADAVKFQTFKAEKVISRFAHKADYQKQTTDPRETQLEMVRQLEMDPVAHETTDCLLPGEKNRVHVHAF